MGDAGGKARVSFDGTGSGSHDDETECDDDGTLVGSGQVDRGQVEIRVTDGEGNQLFVRTLDGGFNVESEALAGASGSWTLSATRMADGLLQEEFAGDYSFRMTC